MLKLCLEARQSGVSGTASHACAHVSGTKAAAPSRWKLPELLELPCSLGMAMLELLLKFRWPCGCSRLSVLCSGICCCRSGLPEC